LARIGLIVGTLVVSGLSILPAHAAATRYVSPDGTGASCTETDPCAVQTAIALSAADDLVLMVANRGNYQLTGDLSNLPNAPIRLHSFAGRAQLVFSTGQLKLTGGNVDGLSVHGSTSSAAFALSGDAVGSRMIVHAGNGQPACALSGATLINSVCTATAESGTIAISTEGSNVLRNDTFVGGTTAAVLANGDQSACGCTEANDTLVNVIARSASSGKDITAQSDGDVAVTVKATYSNFATTSTTGTGAPSKTVLQQDATDQTAAPLFDTQVPGDTHQAAGSPTIDAGRNAAANGVFDVDGNARIMGTKTDIGADEFVSPPDTIITLPTINHAKGKATFAFKSLGPSTGFECQLMTRPSGVIPPYKSCTSPKTYRHLAKGKWRFRVRAIGVGGTDASPAKVLFHI
jgi:hypothetical protein